MRDLPDNILIGIILAVCVATAAFILWLRDRWWDRHQVSNAERERQQLRLKIGTMRLTAVCLFIAGVSILVKSFIGWRQGQDISSGLPSLLFLWLGYQSWKWAPSDRRSKGNEHRGTPPPFE